MHTRERVTDLIVDWGHYGTNGRRAKGRMSSITKITEIRYNLTRH
jgi:hypothetical protein